MRYTYSRWDGAQLQHSVGAEEIIEALADQVIAGEDLDRVLRDVAVEGLYRHGEQVLPGLNDVLRDVQAQRREELARYDLDSTLDDIRAQIENVLARERAAIEDTATAAGAVDVAERDVIEAVMQRKRVQLAGIDSETASAVAALSEYEFLDDFARIEFGGLVDTLRQHVLQRHFSSMTESLERLAGRDFQSFKQMVADLDKLIRDRLDGSAQGFDAFQERYGDHFPDATSLEDMLGQMRNQAAETESLLASISPEMRRGLEETLRAVLSDEAVRAAMGRISEGLDQILPPRPKSPAYPFHGEEDVPLEQALRLMRRMHELDRLEADLRQAVETGGLASVDMETLRRVLNAKTCIAVERVCSLTDLLKGDGYARGSAHTLELTARGMRKIGEKALRDIFADVTGAEIGGHAHRDAGPGSITSACSRGYEFGDPFLLDLPRTLMNAVVRNGAETPVRLHPADFQVFETEVETVASTVLMLDMSQSMPLRGCMEAATKLTLALHTLVSTQYPRDHLHVIAFSDFAHEVRPEDLYRLSRNEAMRGTNMQHGFLLARRLLSRYRSGTRQIILVTDGEPTAHCEANRVEFSYPPGQSTVEATLREVKRCSEEGIVINTFMLERNHYLADFVRQMSQLNRGRAFYVTPERLGDYVLVDYLKGRSTPG